MTTDRDFDRQLADWFDDRAPSTPPADLLARSLARLDGTRQRPAWLVGGGATGRSMPVGQRLVPAWVVAAVVALLTLAVAAAGARLVLPAVVVGPSPSPEGTAEASPVTAGPSPTATSAGLLGGGPILAHTFTRFGDPGPFDVVAIDAGSGTTTLLGTLPGSSVTDSSLPYTFMRNRDLTRVVLIDGALQDATAAAEPFGFASVSNAAREDDWIALSPAGDRIAAIHVDGQDVANEIVVMTLDGSVQARSPIPTGLRPSGLRWAPDGATLLTTGCRPCNKASTPTEKQTSDRSHLYLIPIDGSPWTELLDVANGGLDAQFSPDGTRLAVERFVCAAGSFMPRCDPMEATSSLSVLTLATGSETSLGDTPGITGVEWSPDGTNLAYGALDGAYAVDAATGTRVSLAEGQAFGADWSPDGQWLLLNRSGQDGFESFDVWIVRADGSELHKVLAGYAGATW